MATHPPTSTVMRLPAWMLQDQALELLRRAEFDAEPVPDGYLVRACEHQGKSRHRVRFAPVRVHELLAPDADSFQLTPLVEAEEREVGATTQSAIGDGELRAELDRLAKQGNRAAWVGYLAPRLHSYLLRSMNASAAAAAATVVDVMKQLRAHEMTEDGGKLFSGASAYLLTRSGALLTRVRLMSVLLRLVNDSRLAGADLAHIARAFDAGESVFDSSGGLGDGTVLLDCYLGPLLGALTPDVWAVAVFRPAGILIYGLGTTIAGIAQEPVESLQLLPGGEGGYTPVAPHLAASAPGTAIGWWCKRLNKMLGVLTDPALYSDPAGEYVAAHNLHAILTVEQLFRRVAAIQRVHRDPDARRVLLFTALDTLERLTEYRLIDMCTLATAEQALVRVRSKMLGDEALVLMPAAQRAVDALRRVQDGFFIARQAGQRRITYSDGGSDRTLAPEEAAAEYILLLRNATHGHGTIHADRRALDNALLGHHDGRLDHDLALLPYLYLLDVLTRPDQLRRRLWQENVSAGHAEDASQSRGRCGMMLLPGMGVAVRTATSPEA